MQAFNDAEQAFKDAEDPEFWQQLEQPSNALPVSEVIMGTENHFPSEENGNPARGSADYQDLMEREALIGLSLINHGQKVRREQDTYPISPETEVPKFNARFPRTQGLWDIE